MEDTLAARLSALWLGRPATEAEARAMAAQADRAAPLAMARAPAGALFAVEPAHFDRLLQEQAKR
ncbi:hypothetical protein [Pseudoxanthobacter sp.]|uniref:hypothetical protein n=1 Tax=Pseudoxanthobacter sp. TaxID=1925742 RepID=UPI002FE0E53D